jgi:hypothetical protein
MYCTLYPSCIQVFPLFCQLPVDIKRERNKGRERERETKQRNSLPVYVVKVQAANNKRIKYTEQALFYLDKVSNIPLSLV